MGQIYIVKQGECLSLIAARHGYSDWKKLYDHPRNKELRKKRPDPNLLHPGDEIYIPERQSKRETCKTGRRHRFVVRLPKKKLQVILLDSNDEPIAGKPYELKVGKLVLAGTTSSSGLVTHDVPVEAEHAELTVVAQGEHGEESACFALEVGHLDPADEISGMQARLNNLGYDCGTVDGAVGPITQAAVADFRKLAKLPAAEELDAETIRQVMEMHGC